MLEAGVAWCGAGGGKCYQADGARWGDPPPGPIFIVYCTATIFKREKNHKLYRGHK